MIIYIIAGCGIIGLLLLAVARATEKSNNLDEASSAVIPAFLGMALLSCAVILTIGYALFRLFWQ